MREGCPTVGDNIGGGRALHVCDYCGGVDDHPRHQFAGAVAGQPIIDPPAPEIIAAVMANAPDDQRTELVRTLVDRSTVDLHLDCCRAAGCPTGECDERTAGAEHLRGADLLDHLVTHPTHLAAVAALAGQGA
jgi:hypothetical protein